MSCDDLTMTSSDLSSGKLKLTKFIFLERKSISHNLDEYVLNFLSCFFQSSIDDKSMSQQRDSCKNIYVTRTPAY